MLRNKLLNHLSMIFFTLHSRLSALRERGVTFFDSEFFFQNKSLNCDESNLVICCCKLDFILFGVF